LVSAFGLVSGFAACVVVGFASVLALASGLGWCVVVSLVGLASGLASCVVAGLFSVRGSLLALGSCVDADFDSVVGWPSCVVAGFASVFGLASGLGACSADFVSVRDPDSGFGSRVA
jgi:hypothetical protein